MYLVWVKSLGVGVYVCGCLERWAGGMFSGVVICIMEFIFQLFF